MGSCSSCGSWVPDDQPVCSMCYGDPYYGRDGYYLDWLDQEYAEQDRRRAEEERQAAEESLRAAEEQAAEAQDAGNESVDGFDLPF